MDSLSATINKTVNAAVVSTVKSYVNEFASKLAKEINSKDGKKKEWKAEDFVTIWNTLAKDFVVKKGGKKKSDPVDPECQCHHVYGKGDKKDSRCEDKISEKSTSNKYCVRHYKQQEKDKKPKKEGEDCNGECCYILTKGDNEGNDCGVKVSAKSKSGKYCSKHIAEEKKAKKINKTELLKFIRASTKDVDEDEDALKEAFSEVEKKFGYMAIYNMETLAPKMYEKFQSAIDSLIEDGREDNDESIKEAEVEEEEKATKEKEEKDAKKKKTSKKKEVADEEEVSKSGSKKKEVADEEKSEKKVSKSGSKKKEVADEKSGYEDGAKLVAGSPRVKAEKSGSKKSKTPEEEEVVEEEEEVVEEEEEEEDVKISAKKFKEGDLKGQVYFIDTKTETTFLLNAKERTVSHKIVDGKKISLNSVDKARLVKYDLTAA